MADAIGPGDWVEYVGITDEHTPFEHIRNPLQRGHIYVVTEVGRRCRDAKGRVWPSIRVNGGLVCDSQGFQVSYPVAAFRPIYRPKAQLLESLLRKTTQPIREDA